MVFSKASIVPGENPLTRQTPAQIFTGAATASRWSTVSIFVFIGFPPTQFVRQLLNFVA
jgi:hypothetical protein